MFKNYFFFSLSFSLIIKYLFLLFVILFKINLFLNFILTKQYCWICFLIVIRIIFHNHKIMDNISKTKNKFNVCFLINNRNSFMTKNYLFKSSINFLENTVIKHCNIIFSNSHKKAHNIVWIQKKYYDWMRIFDKRS